MPKPAQAQGSGGTASKPGTIGPLAEIVREQELNGNIRIRCPNCLSEYEVPKDATEFTCPIDELILKVSVKK